MILNPFRLLVSWLLKDQPLDGPRTRWVFLALDALVLGIAVFALAFVARR